MKKILLITLIATGLNSFAQKDTLTEQSSGYEFELYKNNMFVIMSNDTVVNATFTANKNQLEWGNTPMQFKAELVNISDSIIFLLKESFQSIVNSVGANSFTDDYGVYTLNAININYSIDSVSNITCLYEKQLKSPSGGTLERFIAYNNALTPEQVTAFETLLLSAEVKSMYLKWYNEILGNI